MFGNRLSEKNLI